MRSLFLAATACAVAGVLTGCEPASGPPIVVGSKDFTESILLGEILAQQLERHDLPVERRLDTGGTNECHAALLAGTLDVYVEYTGTAYSAILRIPEKRSALEVTEFVANEYRDRFKVEWLAPLGFNNTWAIFIKREVAVRFGVTRLSQVRAHAQLWSFGASREFLERPDGYGGLVRAYGLTFKGDPVALEVDTLYMELAKGNIDMTAGNSTDARIEKLNLVRLEDDLEYFPVYYAFPVARMDTLARHPGARLALQRLRDTLTEDEIRELNYLVDIEKRRMAAVAGEFLSRIGQ